MKRYGTYWPSIVLALVVVGLLLPAVAQCAPKPNPIVIPPTSVPYGKTYGDWGAEWWKWVFSFEAAPWGEIGPNPIQDPTGEFNMQKQSGPVWFLGGTWIGPVTREVQIPPGRAIFFAILNIVVDYPCPPEFGFEPPPGQSLEDFLTEVAASYIDPITEESMSAEVDGKQLTNLLAYRGTSKLFMFTGDPSWPVVGMDPCVTGGPQPGVSDGYWIMLAPMKPGSHTIHFAGELFGQDVTYNITVK